MPTIAITGATGFIGGKLAAYFAAKNYRVLAFGRRLHPNLPASVEYFRWDISERFFQHSTPLDAVIHCASSVSDWGEYRSMYRVNVAGTHNVLQSFSHAQQFIHISTASVYDPYQPKIMVKEAAAYGATYLNHYSTTKMLAEIAVKASRNQNRVIVRPHIVYGPQDTTLYPRLMQARKFGRFLVIGNGENHLSLTYIDNLCQALELIMQKKFEFEIFNIADDCTDKVNNILAAFLTTLKLKEKIMQVDANLALRLGKLLEASYSLFGVQNPPLISRYLVTQMASEYTLDITKAKTMLGYRPIYDYKTGFVEFKRWLDGEYA